MDEEGEAGRGVEERRRGARGRTLSVMGEEAGYKETRVEPFTILSMPEEEETKARTKMTRQAVSSGGLSKAGVRQAYLRIWCEQHGLRITVCLLLAIAGTAAVAGCIRGFHRTEVRWSEGHEVCWSGVPVAG
jgi:hypothetical protein